MKILILDAIHGGWELERHLTAKGHTCRVIDVYRGNETPPGPGSLTKEYDLAIVPVHLDPDNPWLEAYTGPSVSHHAAVRWLIGKNMLSPMIEITGSCGKTTTAFALASLFQGPGILHTSAGDWEYPTRRYLGRTSITPSYAIARAHEAELMSGWYIAEISLGLTGAGSLGIITSDETYTCANGKRDALFVKLSESSRCRRLLVAGKIPDFRAGILHVEEYTSVDGDILTYNLNGLSGSIKNPLLLYEAYRTPLTLATAAACLFSLDPSGLSGFSPVQGRLDIKRGSSGIIIDNSNSGTTFRTTADAINLARTLEKTAPVTLIIGQDGHAVCERFSEEDIVKAIILAKPDFVVLIEGEESINWKIVEEQIVVQKIPYSVSESLEKLDMENFAGTTVLSVKTWR